MNERVDEDVELSELRRRAYGAAGSIDAAGIARLAQLEELRRRRDEVIAIPKDGEAGSKPPPDQPPEAPHPVDPVDPVEPTPSVSAPAARRTRRWPWVLGGLLIGALAGVSIAPLLPGGGAPWHQDGRPDAMLTPVDDGRGPGVFTVDTVTYEYFYDLDVRSWTDTTSREQLCLGFASRSGGGLEGEMWATCAPAGLDPVFDVEVFETEDAGASLFAPGSVGGAAVGTRFRFVLDDDVVKVWRIEPADPAVSG